MLEEIRTSHGAVLVDLLLAAAVIAFTIPTTVIGHSFSLWDGTSQPVELAVGSLTAATMLVRRYTPWPAIVAGVVCACLVGQTVPMVLAVFSMTAEHRTRSWTYVALGLMAVYLVVDYENPYTDRIFYLSVVRALTLVYLPALVGTWVYDHRRRFNELRAGAREREESAVLEERRRIARELHDTVTHAVTGMVLNAGLIRDPVDPADIPELAEGIEDKGVEALGELRQLLTMLRREDVPVVEAAEAVDRLAEEARAAGLRVDVRLDVPPGALPPEVTHVCYRLVQEGLNNVRRHAPDSDVRITGAIERDHVDIAVVNTPSRTAGGAAGGAVPGGQKAARTPPLRGAGYGLAGIRERVALLGGSLTAGRAPTGVPSPGPAPPAPGGGAAGACPGVRSRRAGRWRTPRCRPRRRPAPPRARASRPRACPGRPARRPARRPSHPGSRTPRTARPRRRPERPRPRRPRCPTGPKAS
ncbi:sensor histidine kinase [Microbispora amethystogenes]|nr:histidine kinase [Microbispora amethystogenes]